MSASTHPRIVRSHTARQLRCGAVAASLILMSASAFAGSFTYFGFDEAAYSEKGREGLKQINSGEMFHAAVPLGIVKGRAARESKMQAELGYDPSSPEGTFYTKGSPPSEGDSGLPLGLAKLDRNGAPFVSITCFLCHAGVVNGVVVAGLGSNSVMLENAPERGTSRGDNYGQYAVWKYAAQVADPANTGLRTSTSKTDLVKLIDSTPLPPVQPMPWWVMKYKVRDYWYGDGAPTDAAHFSLNFTVAHPEVNENHAAHVAATARALAFARETQSPLYPGALDPALVQAGADLFHGRTAPADPSSFRACYQCHGTYTKKAAQTDYAKPGSWDVKYDGSEKLRDVGTDASYNEVIGKFQPIIDHLTALKQYYEAQGTPELMPVDQPLPGKGYVPPPLVGVWATAPYFHNGSVPTIEAVLNSSLRPEIWARNQSPQAYDLAKVGMEYTSLTRAEFDEAAAKAASVGRLNKAAVDLTFVYDTKSFGRANTGHTFGDSLSAAERAAIIEFLKSLSGSDM